MSNNPHSFSDLKVMPEIINELEKININNPTQIQIDSIPKILDNKNILIKAMTGTGKTAAFAIPIIQKLASRNNNFENKKPKAIIISPNRELSIQISDTFKKISNFCKLRTITLIGGVHFKKQLEMISRGIDILVVTPGRCRDLLEQRKLNLSSIEFFVLDEVDLMLDMGFIDDIKFIKQQVNPEVQTIFVSATIPSKIKSLSKEMLKEHAFVEVKNDQEVQLITEEMYFMDRLDKKNFVLDLIQKNKNASFIIFMNMKRKVDELERFLAGQNIMVKTIHSEKTQFYRQDAIKKFKNKMTNILIATDIAARGIHVDNVNFVINFDVPNNADNYVHRKGRTGRAGVEGRSILLCSPEEVMYLERIIKQVSPSLLPIKEHKWHIDINLEKAFSNSGKNNVFSNNYRGGRTRRSNQGNNFNRNGYRSNQRSFSDNVNRFSGDFSSQDDRSKRFNSYDSQNKDTKRPYSNFKDSNRSSNRSFKNGDKYNDSNKFRKEEGSNERSFGQNNRRQNRSNDFSFNDRSKNFDDKKSDNFNYSKNSRRENWNSKKEEKSKQRNSNNKKFNTQEKDGKSFSKKFSFDKKNNYK